MKIICLHPNLLRRMLEPLGTTEIQRFQGAHGSAAAAAMAPLPGVTNRKLVHNLFSSLRAEGASLRPCSQHRFDSYPHWMPCFITRQHLRTLSGSD